MKLLRKKGSLLYLGVDPGLTGWICAYDGRRIVAMVKIPWLASEADLIRLFRIFEELRRHGAEYAMLEHQQPFGPESARASFTLGGGYIALKAALTAAEIPFDCPEPDVWKAAMGIPPPGGKLPKLPKKPPEGETLAWRRAKGKVERARKEAKKRRKAKRKEISCRKAQELAPGHDFRRTPACKGPDDNKCESFLLAVHAYRTHARSE